MANKIDLLIESQYRGEGVAAARRDINAMRDEMVRQAAATGRNVSEVVDRGLSANRRAGRTFAESLQEDLTRRGEQADEEAMLAVGEQRVGLLEREALLGDEKSRRMLLQLQLESRHAREMEKLVALSKNALLSDQARAQVNAQIAQLQRVQGAELAKLNAQGAGGGLAGGFSNKNALTQGLAVAGSIFAGLEVVKGGLRVIGTTTALIRGDLDAADRNLSRLPFGLGEIYTASRDVYGEVSGITAEYEAQQRTLKAIASFESRRAEEARKFGEEMRRQRADDEKLRQGVRIGALGGSAAQTEPITAAMMDAIREREKFGKEQGESPDRTARAVADIRARARQEIEALRRSFIEGTDGLEFEVRIGRMTEFQREMAEAQKRFSDGMAEVMDNVTLVGFDEAARRERNLRERMEREIADIRERHTGDWLGSLAKNLPGIVGPAFREGFDALAARVRRERSLQSQVLQGSLREQGQHLEAQLESIRERFREMWRNSTSDAERASITELEAQAERDARRGAQGDTRFRFAGAQESRFLTNVGNKSASDQLAAAQATKKAAEQAAKSAEQAATALNVIQGAVAAFQILIRAGGATG